MEQAQLGNDKFYLNEYQRKCCLFNQRFLIFSLFVPRHNDEPEHTKRRTPKKAQTPGPQTYDPGKIRNAIYVQSNQRNIPGLKFGTGKRACNADNSSKRKTPSLAEYDPEMIRRGIMFSKSGSTNVKFGTAQINGKKVSATPCPQVRRLTEMS